MPVRTEARQPVVYDMMLLADALVALPRFRGVRQRDPLFCERQKNFEIALTKIRCLAQFMSATGQDEIMKITDPEFGGIADKSFMKSHFDTISKYLSHLSEQRYKKEEKYPRPTATVAMKAGKEILNALKRVMDVHKAILRGDAAHWYSVFEDRYKQLFA